MQQRVNGKTARVIQKRHPEPNLQTWKRAEEFDAPKRNYNPLENVTCKIGDNACAAKYVSAIQRTGILHPMSKSQRVQSLTKLQRQYGNRFVQRVIARSAIQTKLRIGQPGDIYEQEADRVAEQVTRMPDSQVQRQEEEEEEEEEEPLRTKPIGEQIIPLAQRQIEEEEEKELQAKGSPSQIPRIAANDEVDGAASEVTSYVQSQIDSLRDGGGEPLPESVRGFFEPRFGVSLNQVRVHRDSRAAEAAQSVNARAFTVGRDVVFGAGQYSPETTTGRRLLAHELTHTIQQNGGMSNIPINLHEVIRRGTPPPPAKPKGACKSTPFVGASGLKIGAGKTWYPHDFAGTIGPKDVRAKASSTGYEVPSSMTSSYNCMGWALCSGQSSATWRQGVPRDKAHPWPEEELLASEGCSKVTAGKSASHKVKLYEYIDRDQFHIVRQECDGLWSAKTGVGPLWRGIQNSDAHTTSYYSQKMKNLRVTYWSCP